ncbi:MAG: PhoX family phosphatase [Actinobacteria bacterium]|nr:PhoX family phosphatase [Actinomycetota bacterium]
MTDAHIEADQSQFEDVVRERMSRRGALKTLVVLGGTAAGSAVAARTAQAAAPYAPGELTFDALPLNTADQISTAVGFKHDVVISWGDPVVPGAPALNVDNQTAATQAQQFGFNNDWVGIYPLGKRGDDSYRDDESDDGEDKALMFVNHEYTSANMMFPGVTYAGFNSAAATTAEQKLIEIEAHGASVVKVVLKKNSWRYRPNSRYNRRITGSTPMQITGPVAGNVHLRTNADPTGTAVKGMLNNCGGGTTPWGTALTAEENFDQYFANRGLLVPGGDLLKKYAQDNASVFGIGAGASSRGWELVDDRFDMTKEWNEPFRFGWIVEIDPYDPTSVPKKRTALGRFKHEAAAGTRATNGKYVVYMGDDQAQQCIYKFVSDKKVQRRASANADLLDSGTLYVATFLPDGTGVWKPLVFGTGPLVSPTFEDQADVLIRTRIAAGLLGGTKMDRPEDVEVNPKTGFIYAAMTGTSRSAADAANPRLSNAATDPDSSRGGHIIEIREASGDHTGLSFAWEIFMLCGNPNAGGTLDAATVPAAANSSGRTYFAGFDESQVSPIARPDNVAFDSRGNLWISTDGMPSLPSGGGLQKNDSFYGVPTAGPERGHLKALASVPLGAEATGPYFTADDKTLFGAVQHPGEDGNNLVPQSTWNAVSSAVVPGSVISRNAVVAIRRVNGTSIPAGRPATASSASLGTSSPVGAIAAVAAAGGLLAFRQQRMAEKLEQPASE